MVPALPFGGELAEEALHGVVLGVIGGEGEGFAVGWFEKCAIAQGIGDANAGSMQLAGQLA